MGNVFEFDLFKLSLSYLVFFGNHAIGVKYTMIYWWWLISVWEPDFWLDLVKSPQWIRYDLNISL
jgi:hypothetical protein